MLKFILIALSFLYAGLMIYATVSLVSISTHRSILIVNLVGGVTVFLYILDYRFLYVGILLLFISALLNGFVILNRITLSHVFIRFIFSLMLIGLNFYVHHQ